MPAPKVLAKIGIKIQESDLELGLNWKSAPDAKLEAATWLRRIDQDVLPESVTVRITLRQKSKDIPDFVDEGFYRSRGRVGLGIEYGAQWIERYPNWGRSR